MCQGQFKLSGQEEVRACASRASAASLDVHLPGCLAVQIFTMWLRDPAVATIMRMSGDEFSVLTPQQKVETAAARRSGGTYTASIPAPQRQLQRRQAGVVLHKADRECLSVRSTPCALEALIAGKLLI